MQCDNFSLTKSVPSRKHVSCELCGYERHLEQMVFLTSASSKSSYVCSNCEETSERNKENRVRNHECSSPVGTLDSRRSLAAWLYIRSHFSPSGGVRLYLCSCDGRTRVTMHWRMPAINWLTDAAPRTSTSSLSRVTRAINISLCCHFLDRSLLLFLMWSKYTISAAVLES